MGRRRKNGEGELRLSDKRHPPLGIAASIFALISLISFCAACFISGEQGGNAGIGIGAVGLLCFFVSAAGFAMAWVSLHQDNIKPLFPTIGSLANGILLIGYMILYIFGAA